MIRAAFYIDGFNVYHAIDDLQRPHLKWLDYSALALRLIPKNSETVVRTVMCTAMRTDKTDKLLRQRALVKALRARGVECLIGHFAEEERECHHCGNRWMAPVEKQGDTNLSNSVIDDAHMDVFDHCYLITADGDQASTARILKARFPAKRLTTVAPPGRAHNKIILSHADSKLKITTDHLEACLLPKTVQSPEGLILRPTNYDPPGS